MKAARLFTAILLTALTFTSSHAQDWAKDNLDLRKALPNITDSPVRKVPVNSLAPIADSQGIIRRVRLYDDELKACALTFDMCELDTVTTGCDMDVINFLREKNIPATLFMGGKWMRTHSRRVKQIMTAKNFEIANHNWSHGNCALLSSEGLKAQVLWTQSQYELLREEAGLDDIQPVPTLFRLPYGRSSESAVKIINELGLRVIQWDVAAESGDNSNMKRAKRSARLVADMTRPGSILLFHANLVPKGTINLLREVVSILESRGYEFVKVSELLEMGEPEITRDGYFTKPGDNKALDKKFGIDGTGRKTRFTGK
ncbi:MAG: polysaccharide deacetylase family protein [Synergistaceae bacterium]|nr:polysaccharide deacetylase family protein [Synergistaceae bacterium]